MATDYYFMCEKCQLRSEWSFSRQAWGWGSYSSNTTFPFIMKHTRDCGEHNIRCIREESAENYEIDKDIDIKFEDDE